MIINEDEHLAHYGVARRSGRYPWGSGNNEETSKRNQTFLDRVDELKRQGLSDPEICVGMGIGTTDKNGVFRPSTTVLRARRSIAKNQQAQAKIDMAQRLHDKGLSAGAIAKRMGLPGESSVRALLAPGKKDRVDILTKTADVLKQEVEAKKYLDVGSGVERHLLISKERLNTAVTILLEQGYTKHIVPVTQVGTGKDTQVKVLCPPGTTQKEAWEHRYEIKMPGVYSPDGGRTYGKIHEPISIDPKRVEVVYKEDGGDRADGVIYVRPGVEDISLGKKRYAQVRIKVGDNRYLKGMAMYKEGLPIGVDLLFNTNKESTGNKFDAMKKLEDNVDFPFGSVIKRQITADTGTDKERVTSAMNIVNEEGDWVKWDRNLSSQVLSKQEPRLAKTQLAMTYGNRKDEFEDIKRLTNPTVKKKLLESFADAADSAAVHLKAAGLPGQNWHAILPIDSMPPSQIFAPGHRDGDIVVLIRYPHGGIFEIPELTVNNKQSEARRLLGPNPRDAVGIHHSVAERLSGADFDGDTVLVIPNNNRKVKIAPALEGLKNFDTRSAYPPYDGMKTIDGGFYNAKTKEVEYGEDGPSGTRKQHEMGNVSNLITDMTLKAASHDKIVRAIRHSMVVIDAEKHHLNYRESAIRNGIRDLKKEYQGGPRAGASTLISRKKSEVRIPKRKPRPQAQGGPVDKLTGRRMYVETGQRRKGRDGESIVKEERIKKLALTDDANTLVSTPPGTPMERIYADHSNSLKELANQARLAAIKTPALKYSASAKKAYAPQVASLDSKLALVQMNRPLERQAQVIARSEIRALREANPNLDGDSLKKIEYQIREKARARTGARKRDIVIEPDEWDAIQAGAISNNQLWEILAKADLDEVRKLATPRTAKVMSSAKKQKAKQLLAAGYTRAQVADRLGVSLSTLDLHTVGEES